MDAWQSASSAKKKKIGLRHRFPLTPALNRISSLPLVLSFHDRDVSIDGKICKSLAGSAGLRPGDFQPVDLSLLAKAKHYSRVMSRQKAPSAEIGTRSLQVRRLIGDPGAYGIRV